jgi:hypothetical protein
MKNLPVAGRALLSVVTETLVTKGIKKYPLFIESTDTVFTLATEQNLKDLVHENKEKDDQIRELEEEVRRGKKDKGSLKEFKICIERGREELHEMTMDMYANLQVFQ